MKTSASARIGTANGNMAGENSRKSVSKVAYAGLLLALLLVIVTRVLRATSAPWPLNDGGLFLVMTRAIESHNFLLPASIRYPVAGTDTIPFCYPPLGFYLALLVSKLGLPLELYLKIAPSVWSAIAVWAFWRLALVLFDDKRVVAAATFAYAAFPYGHVWLNMGGGVARGPSLVFAFLTLEQVARLWRTPAAAPPASLPTATALLAGTLACQLERFHFCLLSIILLWAMFGRTRQSFRQLAFMTIGAVLLTSPWWGLSLSRFGLEPFLAASASGGSLWARTSWSPFWTYVEPLIPAVTLFGVLGTGMLIRQRQWLIPAWLVLIAVFEVRSTRTFFVVPFAMAAGVAAAAFWPREGIRWASLRWAVLGLVVLWSFAIGSVTFSTISSLTPPELSAMKWARQDTSSTDNFLILPVYDWASDQTAEWFPALADRRSLSTVQGSEWLRDEFGKRVQRHEALRRVRSWPEIQQWLGAGALKANYLWVPREPARNRFIGLEKELAGRPGVRLAYSNRAVGIYRLPDEKFSARPR